MTTPPMMHLLDRGLVMQERAEIAYLAISHLALMASYFEETFPFKEIANGLNFIIAALL